jgi:GNAT superfamily N-acetyltransferase
MAVFMASNEKDLKSLNAIAFASEGFWCHSEEMMEVFKKEYKLTKKYLKNNKVFNMMLNDEIIGFYAFNMTELIPALEYFYLNPKYIGKGFGRILWNEVIKFCKDNKIKKFNFVAGPEVKDYYLKMGAKITQTLTSKLDNERKIYQFKMELIMDET